MRLCRRVMCWLAGGVALLALGYGGYVRLGGPADEAAVRERGCLLCHAQPTELMPCLRSVQPGEPISPVIMNRLQRVHPLLGRGEQVALAAFVAKQQLPLLARSRAGAPGEALYLAKCAACHGKNGAGVPGEYPPLMRSEWITAEPSRLPEILSQGLAEPISVLGVPWNKTMRAPGISSPEEIQQLMDYLRATFAAH